LNNKLSESEMMPKTFDFVNSNSQSTGVKFGDLYFCVKSYTLIDRTKDINKS